jgi:hypothetical protein
MRVTTADGGIYLANPINKDLTVQDEPSDSIFIKMGAPQNIEAIRKFSVEALKKPIDTKHKDEALKKRADEALKFSPKPNLDLINGSPESIKLKI